VHQLAIQLPVVLADVAVTAPFVGEIVGASKKESGLMSELAALKASERAVSGVTAEGLVH